MPRENGRSRRHQSDDKCYEVQWVEQDRHSLVPTQNDQHHVHPVWDLRDTRHGTPLRFDVVRVCVPAEPI